MQGTRAPQAAGKIHTDLEKGFIAAEITPCHGFLTGAKPRVEGRDYVMQDGDVAVFRFNKPTR